MVRIYTVPSWQKFCSAENWLSTSAGEVRHKIFAGVTEGIFCIFGIAEPRYCYKGANICSDGVTGEHWKA